MIEEIVPSREIEEARAAGGPLVALESTIITHGMPWPQNVETARAVEAIVREEGAIPATIAVIDGVLRIGLDDEELESIARPRDTGEEVMKLSRADLAIAIAMGRTGSTTVAATMMAAQATGIRVFATGGIGGVHRGASDSFDVSADLEELSRTPVCVVASGPKALLDIAKTLEVLESRGVPVICYGTDEMPAFWSRSSGLEAPYRLDTVDGIARLLTTRARLGGHGGMLVANPVPEADEIPAEQMAGHIEAALAEAQTRNIRGKQVTPFMLQRILELTDGRSLETNIALVKSNARLAARIAVAHRAEQILV